MFTEEKTPKHQTFSVLHVSAQITSDVNKTDNSDVSMCGGGAAKACHSHHTETSELITRSNTVML